MAGYWIMAMEKDIIYGNFLTKWQDLAMVRMQGNLGPNFDYEVKVDYEVKGCKVK